MNAIMRVPLHQVVCEKKPAINTKSIKFALMIVMGYKFPPIPVRVVDGIYKLTGGRHRFYAHKLARQKDILISVAVPQEPYPYKALLYDPRAPRRTDKRIKLPGLTPVAKE